MANKIRKWNEVYGNAAPYEGIAAFLESSSDSYAILQLKNMDETAFERLMSIDYLKAQGKELEIDHYEIVYMAPLLPYKDINTMLEETYVKFNMDIPSDFTGHSLSVSDIVALKQNGVISCHYVDTVGFKELSGFLKPENYLKHAEMSMEDDYGMIDGVINNGKREERAEKNSVLEQLKYKQEELSCIGCPKKTEERELE